jgi:hypothetical protein
MHMLATTALAIGLGYRVKIYHTWPLYDGYAVVTNTSIIIYRTISEISLPMEDNARLQLETLDPRPNLMQGDDQIARRGMRT